MVTPGASAIWRCPALRLSPGAPARHSRPMPSPAPITRRALALVAISAALAACGDATPSVAPAADAAVVADVVVADGVAALDAGAPAVDVPPEPDVIVGH